MFANCQLSAKSLIICPLAVKIVPDTKSQRQKYFTCTQHLVTKTARKYAIGLLTKIID